MTITLWQKPYRQTSYYRAPLCIDRNFTTEIDLTTETLHAVTLW